MEQFSNEGRRSRREYTKEFNAQLVAACAQPGASVGGVAFSHELHANMVHRWIRESGTVRALLGACADAVPSFISLPLSAAVASTGDEQALGKFPPSPLSSPPSTSEQVHLQRGELVVSPQPIESVWSALARGVAMIRVDAIWLYTQPLDMRAGPETALARVVHVFGKSYLFANARANRMMVLIHDGIGVWLAARRLKQGKFAWGYARLGSRLTMSTEQLQALVTGLPWQRLREGACDHGAVMLSARWVPFNSWMCR